MHALPSTILATFAVAALAIGCSADDGDRSATGPGTVSLTGGAPADGTAGDDHGDGSTAGTDSSVDSGDESGATAGAFVRTALVGHAIEGSPYFRAVDNFNDDEAIVLAIDPSRFDLQDAQCDAYVVAAKSASAWDADPTLLDVRPGGALPITLAGSLADNRVELAAAGTLSSDAGAGLGVPYDVVLDCDRDGRLNAGDVLDGGAGPGLYRTHDATAPGPLPVSMLEVPGGSFLGQRIFFPTAIADMDALPLVVVTHGWSYTYAMYDYIGEHLASYGYVVMHHEANVQDGGEPGTLTAAADTLHNTDALLANQGSVGGGVLDGHIDARRIMLTGHSTGGEAVVRAVTMLRDGAFSSPHFGYDDVAVVSSMAPVSWHSRDVVDPGDVPYHMFVAGADDDVSGAPLLWYTQCRSIFERATGTRQLTYIHGAGHGDLLDCCGEFFLDESAPDLIGREATKRVARGYFLALAELYLRTNAAGREFFSRPYPDYHPSGIAANVVVTTEYRQGQPASVVLDDFERSPGADDPLARSSAGTAVTLNLPHAQEVLMQDNDGSFAWTGGQPSNGMTHARHDGDTPHALVFDFDPSTTAAYEVEVPAQAQDLTTFEFLSLRACQGTRHPETTALGGPLSFTATLVDATGQTASRLMDGSNAVPPPYARTGEGAGVGWGNEFVTLRLRTTDFLGDNPALDLGAIVAVRFEFGGNFGSSRGRLGLDDIELVAFSAG